MSEKPEEQFNKIANLAGIHVVGEDAQPVVRIDQDLNVTARRLGEVIQNQDLFEMNGTLVYFDHRGERQAMTPTAFRTWINDRVVVAEKFQKDTGLAIPGILTKDAASTILESQNFRRGVRVLTGMNSVRLPVLRPGGALELLPEGYDAQTGVFTTGSLPYDEEMALEAAKGNLGRLFGSFPLTDERSLAVQVAALLSLYVRHLPGGTSLRPGFLWLANKPESGKSVLAKASQYPVLGRAPAVKMKKGEQLDKEMEAFMIAGVPSLFLDNVYGGIESATIDQMLTSEESEGRAMGGHGLFRAKNSAILYVTGNRLELNTDAERRFLVIDLFEKGDPMERVFPDSAVLNDDSMKDPVWRAQMLAICWAMVKHWHTAGMPAASVVRGSFETYSKLLGGIVEAAGYVPPFQRAEIPDAINPDQAEFVELLEEVLCDMGLETERDYTLEDLAKLARRRGIFEKQVGTQADGRKLTIKEDKLDKTEASYADDRGILTDSHRSSFGKKIKKMAGGEPKVRGKRVEFGKRYQARKSTFSIKVLD